MFATAAAPSIPAAIVACAYDSSHCSTSGLGLVPGATLTFTKQQLADACKGGGYAAVGTSNQGRCVDFVEHTFPAGTTLVVSAGGPVEGLASDGNGGLIAN